MAHTSVLLPEPLGPTTMLSCGPGRNSAESYVRKLCIATRTMLPSRYALGAHAATQARVQPSVSEPRRRSSRRRPPWPGGRVGAAAYERSASCIGVGMIAARRARHPPLTTGARAPPARLAAAAAARAAWQGWRNPGGQSAYHKSTACADRAFSALPCGLTVLCVFLCLRLPPAVSYVSSAASSAAPSSAAPSSAAPSSAASASQKWRQNLIFSRQIYPPFPPKRIVARDGALPTAHPPRSRGPPCAAVHVARPTLHSGW